METSSVVASEIQKADLYKLPYGKDASSLNLWDDQCHRDKHIGCKETGIAVCLPPCKYCQLRPQHDYCTVDPASILDDDLQNAWVCTQCRDKEKDRWSLCKLNQQASGEVDSFTIRRAKETTYDEKLSVPNAPYLKKSPSMAMKQHRSVMGYIQQPYRDLHERIMLPPKKRICMNMEISAAQYQDQRLHVGEEAGMASNDACPPTFNSDSMSSLNFRVRHDRPGESEEIVKPGANTSSSLSVKTVGSARDMKPSRLLLRRYKLLSEIV